MRLVRSTTACSLVAAFALFAGCDDRTAPKPSVPTPKVSSQSDSVPFTSGGSDASLPDAKAALATTDAHADKSSLPSTMSEQQKSTAMPLPGQANDHSSPAKADKPASQ